MWALAAFWQPVAVFGGPLDEIAVPRCPRQGTLGWSRERPGGGLFSDLDAIDVVAGLSEASCGKVAILFVVQDQSFSHGLGEL
jgi:hypothetical protein